MSVRSVCVRGRGGGTLERQIGVMYCFNIFKLVQQHQTHLNERALLSALLLYIQTHLAASRSSGLSISL